MGDLIQGAAKAAAFAGIKANIDDRLYPKERYPQGKPPLAERSYAQQTQEAVLVATARTAVYGGSFKENLLASTVDAVTAKVTHQIGNWELSSLAEGSSINAGDLRKIIAHGFVGCASGGIKGESCSANALGSAIAEGISGHLNAADLTDEQSQLIVKLGAAAGAALAGVNVKQSQRAALQVDRNNRALHGHEIKWIKDNAQAFAEQEGISKPQAIQRLSQQALREVDYMWRGLLADGDDSAAQQFLADADQAFVNDLGQNQPLFTAEGQQLLRPEMFTESADLEFYKDYVHSGIHRDLNSGLLKELKDSGVDLAKDAKALGETLKEHPDIIMEGLWEGIKDLPESVVESFEESGKAIGEGAAIALDDDLKDRLNALYKHDISEAQKVLLLARLATTLTGGTVLAKGGAKITDKALDATNDKVEHLLNEAAQKTFGKDDQQLASGGKRGKVGGGAGNGPEGNPKTLSDLPGPKLDARTTSTFLDGFYINRKLIVNTKYYKYHGVDNRTGKKISWLTDKKYSSENELRKDLAIREDWGVKIDKVSEFNVPKDIWVSEGKAAPQGAGYDGGGYQAVIQNISNSWITRTDRAFD